ncbi:hypothetical protein L596_020617 [Steinernema carpocapsae]|uniref:7TM GPCR serpentine receptor class x (Srx) domain-containing protein n=1 Tax=Steinernema carpocapsae TaxID=34508 RepID=A0A4U5MU34_STECR|nr:hypothetical protein L596_020617 [Steinernema carpocapsae]
MQKRLFMQAFYICLLNFVAAFVYCYMQFFPVPMFLITVAQLTWQGSNGGAVVVYLTMNKTIRTGVFELVCCGNLKPSHTSSIHCHTEKHTGPTANATVGVADAHD